MSEVQCQNTGTHKFIWPGREEAYICTEHLQKLLSISQAMGISVPVRPIPEAEATLLPEHQRWKCQQILEE